MSDEIPAIEIDGRRWWATLNAEPYQGLMPTWRAVTLSDLCALVAAMSDEQARQVIASLCERSANYANMVDDAADADASKVLAMSAEELDAEILSCGGDPERLHRWGQVTGKWVRAMCDARAEIEKVKAELSAARRVVAAARGADDALRALGRDSPGMTALLGAYDAARCDND